MNDVFPEVTRVGLRRFDFRTALSVVAALCLFGAVTPVRADSLTIVPTFDSSITNLAGASGIEGAINSAITEIEGDIASPNDISVSIDFQNMTTGLGESDTSTYTKTYDAYYNAYEAVATSAVQLSALASLGAPPTGPGSGNPVNGNTGVTITSAEGRNLGFNTQGDVFAGGGFYDGVISLNTAITSPPGTLDTNTYGLEAVAMHEIDEVLGIGGAGSTLTGSGSLTGAIGDMDLFRYSAPGVRSYSNANSTDPYAYFSIDGGNTVLSYFNQTNGSDFGDWLSNPIPAGFNPQVQDAYGQTGTDPSLGVNELTAFNVIGYELAPVPSIPEPSTLLLSGSVLAIGAGVRRRRAGLPKNRKA